MTLMEFMKPEVDKYAKEYAEDCVKNYAQKRNIELATIMLQRGEDNEYIRLLTHLTDHEIEGLRKNIQ